MSAEPAGFIGYYSRVMLYDYPGLTSKVALNEFRQLPSTDRSLSAFVNRVRLDWLALRVWELDDLRTRFPAAAQSMRRLPYFGPRMPRAGSTAIPFP